MAVIKAFFKLLNDARIGVKANLRNFIDRKKESIMKEYLYSPLKVYIEYSEKYNQEYDCDYWRDEISPEEAANYKSEIDERINKSLIEDGNNVNLINYLDESFCYDNKEIEDAIKEKVIGSKPTTKIVNGKLYGVTELELTKLLNEDEIEIVKDYFSCQYSDGWGEAFEQFPLKINEGNMYVQFWSSDNFYIKTTEEFEEYLNVEFQNQIANELELKDELEFDSIQGMNFNL